VKRDQHLYQPPATASPTGRRWRGGHFWLMDPDAWLQSPKGLVAGSRTTSQQTTSMSRHIASPQSSPMNNPFFSVPSPLRREPLALRPKDAAESLGISERLLLDWTHEYGVPHVRLGRVLLYPVEDLREWLRVRARVEHQSFGLASCENSSDNIRSASVGVAVDPVTATST
jgi:excisionase family DNA binding protein